MLSIGTFAKTAKVSPQQVVDLVAEESKWAFCLPHAISFAKFTKQTAVLKSLHKEAYFAEIERFEQKHGFRWDDIGIRMLFSNSCDIFPETGGERFGLVTAS